MCDNSACVFVCVLQLHSSEVIVDVQEKIMEACAVVRLIPWKAWCLSCLFRVSPSLLQAKFPQKWRSKLVQTFRELKVLYAQVL